MIGRLLNSLLILYIEAHFELIVPVILILNEIIFLGTVIYDQCKALRSIYKSDNKNYRVVNIYHIKYILLIILLISAKLTMPFTAGNIGALAYFLRGSEFGALLKVHKICITGAGALMMLVHIAEIFIVRGFFKKTEYRNTVFMRIVKWLLIVVSFLAALVAAYIFFYNLVDGNITMGGGLDYEPWSPPK